MEKPWWQRTCPMGGRCEKAMGPEPSVEGKGGVGEIKDGGSGHILAQQLVGQGFGFH